MKRLAIVLIGLAFTLPLTACERAAQGPQIDTAQLENGLQIIVIPDFRADVVTHMLWYRVGSADEPKGKSGIAHFFEHLMFRGTEKIAPGEFSKTVARLGGQDNAFTSYDYTPYFQRVQRTKLGRMMEMEAERMQALIIEPDIVGVERDVILEERSMRVDTNPSALLSEQMRARLHDGTAYAVPVIGWRREIEQLNAADASAFYRRFYAPDNAVLVVAGAVRMADVLPLAKRHYGPLKPSGRPRAARQVATNLHVDGHARPQVLRDARVRQNSWRRLYRLPQYTHDDIKLFAAANVAAEILGGGLTGRLYQALVVEAGLASSAGAYADTARLDNGEFMIYGSLAPQVDFSAFDAAMTDVVADLQSTPPTQDEMARAKMQLVSDLIFARDSQQSMAQIFGQAAMLGLTPQDILDWPTHIEAVTAEEVRQAAEILLNPTHSITGHLVAAGDS